MGLPAPQLGIKPALPALEDKVLTNAPSGKSLTVTSFTFPIVVVWSLSRVWLFVTPMDCSTPDFPVLHHLPELVQTHVHWVSDVIQPSHPLSFHSHWKTQRLSIGRMNLLFESSWTIKFHLTLRLMQGWLYLCHCKQCVQNKKSGENKKRREKESVKLGREEEGEQNGASFGSQKNHWDEFIWCFI